MSVGIVQSVRDRIECMRIRPLLQPWLDGQLDDAQRARVAAHVEACRRCGLAASTYRSLKERLRDLGQPADPEAVARLEAFIADLAAEEDDGERAAGD
jgi:anti-sigma factor RsiW